MGPYFLKCRAANLTTGPFHSLKFAVYLYKFGDEQRSHDPIDLMSQEPFVYGLDFQRLEGTILVYLDFVATLVKHLEI